jgi:hypothetical protein
MATAVEKTPNSVGPIEPDVLYPLPIFKRLSGLNNHGMRSARRLGLTVHRFGRRAYVRGGDFISFLGEQQSALG